MEALFGGKQYPDGTYIIDYIDDLVEYQKRFMEVVSDIRSENMMTFPVLSYSLLRKDGKFVDEDFAKWCCKHNMKWNDSNFFVSDDITSLSNCPMSGDTQILYRNTKDNNFKIDTIQNVYDNLQKSNKREITVLSNGQERKCGINKFNEPCEYEIELANGAKLITTGNHLNKVYGKSYVKTKDLTPKDYLPFATKAYEGTKDMTYEDGYLVGMFLGTGEYQVNGKGVVFTLDIDKQSQCISFLKEYCVKKYHAKVSTYFDSEQLQSKHLSIKVSAVSQTLRGLFEQFTQSIYSYKRSIDSQAYSCSKAFRRGILTGVYDSTNSTSNRIIARSTELKDSLITLLATMGLTAKVKTRKHNKGVHGDTHNQTTYVIDILIPTLQSERTKSYIMGKDFYWVKIRKITYRKRTENSYCLEMKDNGEPVFMLANGLHTHNCRLISDVKQLGYFNSIGGTALEVGSVKVNTINLARIAYETNTIEEYLETLKTKTVLCLQALDCIRHIIKRNVDKGLLPNYSKNVMSMTSQYNTIGIIGVYEALQKFGYTYKDKFGNTFYSDEGVDFAKQILKTITIVKDEFAADKDYSVNIEEVPAERAAAVLMEKDKMFYPNQEYELPLYGNQWIPLGVQTTLQEKIRLSAILDKACSGGSIAHINLDAPLTDFDTAWNLLNYVADQGVVYFAFCVRISSCKNNHGFYGDTCPYCGGKVKTTWQRIVGFLTPTDTYSKERKAEFAKRDWFDLDRMKEIG